MDTEKFFPKTLPDCQEAISVCSGCPIKSNCFLWAHENEEVGVWGGHPFQLTIEGLSGEKLLTRLQKRQRGTTGIQMPSKVEKRERVKWVNKLHSSGFSSTEIAAQLDLGVRTVQRCIQQAEEEKQLGVMW